MHGAAVPERRKPWVAITHGTGGVTGWKEDVCERALKRYEEGDGNTQSTNGVVCRRRRIYRLRNVIDWRSPMISEAVDRCEHSTNDICRRRRSEKCQGSRPTTLTKDESGAKIAGASITYNVYYARIPGSGTGVGYLAARGKERRTGCG